MLFTLLKCRAMAISNQLQFMLMHNDYWELRREIAELNTIVIEKNEVIARQCLEKNEVIARQCLEKNGLARNSLENDALIACLRRELNAVNLKMAKLEQSLDLEVLPKDKT